MAAHAHPDPVSRAMASTDHGHHEHHGMSLKGYVVIFALLLVGTFLTVAAWKIEQSVEMPAFLGLLIALSIAVVKAVLVLVYFMHLKFSSRLTWIFAGIGFAWLILLMIGMTGNDIVTRWWLSQAPQGWSPVERSAIDDPPQARHAAEGSHE
jgi:cytochrome c oxidase subunit 4